MTPEQQRIAIAEVCGWKPHPDGVGYYQGEFSIWRSAKPLPDYLTDLNAMHEAEKVLTAIQWAEYTMNLGAIFVRMGVCKTWSDDGSVMAISATAAQRAEAFLRTIGKWKD